jgi:broad specificity phosphatase PhoE
MPVEASGQQLVYLVRHAERADQAAPGGQMQAQTDPLLSAAGEARANKLAAMLKDAGITAIFATEYHRTQDTAQPLAAALGMEAVPNPARDTDGLVARLRAEHAGGVVLLVGHSNTVPAIIKALGGPDVTIGDMEYDNLFIFVPATRTLSRIRY